jgi:hypothetical protein
MSSLCLIFLYFFIFLKLIFFLFSTFSIGLLRIGLRYFFYAVIPVSWPGSRVWDVSQGWHRPSFLIIFYTYFLSWFQSSTLSLLNIEFVYFLSICFLWECPGLTIPITGLLC